MKKTIAAIAVLILLMLSAANAFAQLDNHFVFDAEGVGHIGIASWNGTLYAYRAEKGIYSYHVGDEQPKLLVSADTLTAQGQPLEAQDNPGLTLIGGEGLYVLTDGSLWQYDVQSNAFTPLYRTTRPDEEQYPMLRDYAVVDGKLYAVALDSLGMMANLFRLDAGEAVQVCPGIIRAASYRPGEMLVITSNMAAQPALAVFNTQSGALAEKKPLAGETGHYLSYAPDTDTAYLWNGNAVRRSQGFGETQTALYLPLPQASPLNIAPLSDGWVAVGYYDKVYIAQADPALISVRPLKVMGQSWDLPHDAFRMAYPEIPLELDERFPQSAEMIFADIISGCGADVYVLEANVHDIPLMAAKGYLAGLSSDPALAEAVGGMYPYIRQIAAPGGRVCALPVTMTMTWNLMGYYPESFAQIGLGENDVPKTYAEFLNFAESWQNGASDTHGDMSLFGDTQPIIFRHTMVDGIFNSELIHRARRNEPLSLDVERVVPLLEQIDRIQWDDVSSDASWEMIPFKEEKTPCLFTNYRLNLESLNNYQKEGLEAMPLSIAPGLEPVTDARLTLLAVNASSPSLDAAVAYLRVILENLQPVRLAELMPGLNEPIRYPDYEGMLNSAKSTIGMLEARIKEAESAESRELETLMALHQASLDDLMKSEYYVGPQAIQSFRKHAELLDIPPVNALTSYGNEEMSLLFNRYRAKQLSPAAYVEEVNRKLLMMQREN